MKSRGVEPVVRTFNTVMISCNAAGRTNETLQVYNSMLQNSLKPNTTSFNALISAYSKAHRFEMVWETYKQMIQQVRSEAQMQDRVATEMPPGLAAAASWKPLPRPLPLVVRGVLKPARSLPTRPAGLRADGHHV